MKVEIWPIDRPRPYARNPRKITAAAIEKTAASIREFGFRQPIVVDGKGVIIVGHTRLLAAKQLGLDQVPVHVADMTAAQARAYRIADNRTGEEADWLEDLLGEELNALAGLEIDLSVTGFDTSEIDALLAGVGEAGGDPEAVPETPAVPVTQTGDVWLLGDHRLLCGDSTDEAAVSALLGPAKPHLMVTDPPYGVNYDPGWRNRVKRQDGSLVGAKAIGLVGNDDQDDWRLAWRLFTGDIIYAWHGALHASIAAESLIDSGFQIRCQIIWKKQQFVIGRGHYHWQHEPCWYAVRKGKSGRWTGDRKQSSIWEIDAPSGWRQKTEGEDKHSIHSTQKPVECMKRPIENNSKRGDGVYDPFIGSGTTIIAAEMTGRRCYGMEIAPEYCDVTVRRWEEFSGKQGIAEATGLTFDETRASRGIDDGNTEAATAEAQV